jgi:hypothetical protein
MRTGRTRGALLSRLERLEVRTAGSGKITIRMGDLRRLPADYAGERHIVVAKHLPSRHGQEWVEFEEVPGPDPNPPQPELAHHRGSEPTLISVMFV